jgi:hypothetical protein
MIVPNLDIAALRRRSEARLLLEHLREIHQHDRVAFDQLLKFLNDGMK